MSGRPSTRRRRHPRRGATVLELAIVLGIFVTLTFGMIDMGILIFRYHIISNAACQGARRAIVHGSQASVLGSWGPTKIGPDVATTTGVPIIDGSTDPNYPDGLKNILTSCDLSNTYITVEWIDGSNAPGNRVRVTVATKYSPVVPLFLSSGTLNAVSTMPIAH